MCFVYIFMCCVMCVYIVCDVCVLCILCVICMCFVYIFMCCVMCVYIVCAVQYMSSYGELQRESVMLPSYIPSTTIEVLEEKDGLLGGRRGSWAG